MIPRTVRRADPEAVTEQVHAGGGSAKPSYRGKGAPPAEVERGRLTKREGKPSCSPARTESAQAAGERRARSGSRGSASISQRAMSVARRGSWTMAAATAASRSSRTLSAPSERLSSMISSSS